MEKSKVVIITIIVGVCILSVFLVRALVNNYKETSRVKVTDITNSEVTIGNITVGDTVVSIKINRDDISEEDIEKAVEVYNAWKNRTNRASTIFFSDYIKAVKEKYADRPNVIAVVEALRNREYEKNQEKDKEDALRLVP